MQPAPPAVANGRLAAQSDRRLRPGPAGARRAFARAAGRSATRWSAGCYLDLVGLPPTPEEVDQFVGDISADAYEKLVDRLLASPHYGERWARRWLDLARYADTNGYEKDRARSIWPYRDWVIKALNADMPFDQFTIEQLAGDLLPDATLDQRIATGFHRNTMLNEEGGIDPLEFRFYSRWSIGSTPRPRPGSGLTLGCAQCHTHKYDPIPHAEYYRFMALLNNADEPLIDVPQADVTARRQEMADQIAALEATLAEQFAVEEMRYNLPRPVSVVSSGGAHGRAARRRLVANFRRQPRAGHLHLCHRHAI